ncbi:MAG: radical SAM protein [Nitrospirota bacterium]
MLSIRRKTLLYKTGVEYGDYTINHIEGCSHGCMYPCYAMLMARRFGRVKSYDEWIKPKIVSNAAELLAKEIPKHKDKIKFVHLCFSTDPFMYGYEEIASMSLRLIELLNEAGIKCTALTKGNLPLKLAEFSKDNEYGITLVSLSEVFRKEYEPYAAPYEERIRSLYELHKKGFKTWVSIEPYPTPNIVKQDFGKILKAISFADKIIFGRLNYNAVASEYHDHKGFYNYLSRQVIEFCEKKKKDYHIKDGTISGCETKTGTREKRILF